MILLLCQTSNIMRAQILPFRIVNSKDLFTVLQAMPNTLMPRAKLLRLKTIITAQIFHYIFFIFPYMETKFVKYSLVIDIQQVKKMV